MQHRQRRSFSTASLRAAAGWALFKAGGGLIRAAGRVLENEAPLGIFARHHSRDLAALPRASSRPGHAASAFASPSSASP